MNKKNLNNIKLTSDEKNKMISDIQDFFYENRGEELGVIASSEILDFFIEKLGNKIYNKGLDEAKLWYSSSMQNLQSDYYSIYKNEN